MITRKNLTADMMDRVQELMETSEPLKMRVVDEVQGTISEPMTATDAQSLLAEGDSRSVLSTLFPLD